MAFDSKILAIPHVQLAGESYTRPAGIKHDVRNASTHALSFVEIEIKNPNALFGASALPAVVDGESDDMQGASLGDRAGAGAAE